MNCKPHPILFAGLALGFASSGLLAQSEAGTDLETAKLTSTKGAPSEGKARVTQPSPGVGQPPVGRGGNAWFPVTEQDFGTHFNHDTVVGRFPFENPTETDITWRSLIGSCQCSEALITVGDRRYRFQKKPNPTIKQITTDGGVEHEQVVDHIDVGADEGGEVEVHMELGGIAGVRQATLDIHTTDPKLPMIKLKWSAVGAQVFVISPSEVNLNQMIWNEKREFTVTVQSPIQKDFTIIGKEVPDEDFTVAYDKELTDGTAKWTIQGTYQPHSADVLGGGVLKFFTDIPGQASFTVRVSAAIQGPLEVKPGTFLTLGMIRKGSKRVTRVVFEPNDGSKLEATDIRLEKLTVDPKFVVTRSFMEGKDLVVELEVTDQAPSGLLRGDLVVELNHPAVPSKRILFNGFVR